MITLKIKVRYKCDTILRNIFKFYLEHLIMKSSAGAFCADIFNLKQMISISNVGTIKSED